MLHLTVVVLVVVACIQRKTHEPVAPKVVRHLIDLHVCSINKNEDIVMNVNFVILFCTGNYASYMSDNLLE